MKTIFSFLLFFFAFSLPACQSLSIGKGQPALLTNANEQTISEIESIISQALNKKTLIADSAFSKSATLSIEKKWNKNLNSLSVDDRSLMPQWLAQFQLSIHKSEQCVLTHKETGKQWILENARCMPLP